MTPLIDVSLVLVVILLVATPMAFQSGIAVSRAGTSGPMAKPARSERIEISILADDRIEVNGRPVAADGLERTLLPLIGVSGTRQVVVHCADQVSHGTFVTVLDQARASGAAVLAVAPAVTP
jgi:biopolymer transport protein ExbD